MTDTEKTMPAVQALAPGDLRCIEAKTPEPAPGEALVQTAVASICGSDLHMAGLGWGIPRWPAPPGHPGHEAAGTVIQSRTPRYRPGDRVLTAPHIWNAKCFARYQAIDDAHLTPIPHGLPFRQAAMAQQLGTVIYAARRLENVQGAACAVVGQGSAGLFWNYMLNRLGAATVIALEPVEHRRSLASTYAADHALDPADPSAAESLMDLTRGRGADIVVEAVGKAETLSSAFDLVRDEGQVMLFGLPETDDEVPFRFGAFFRKRATAHTAFGSQEEPGQPCYVQALNWIARGEIDVKPIASHTLPVEHVQRAFQIARSKDDRAVKVALSF